MTSRVSAVFGGARPRLIAVAVAQKRAMLEWDGLGQRTSPSVAGRSNACAAEFFTGCVARVWPKKSYLWPWEMSANPVEADANLDNIDPELMAIDHAVLLAAQRCARFRADRGRGRPALEIFCPMSMRSWPSGCGRP